MIWKITCYNGEVWFAKTTMLLTEAVELFSKETGLCQMDIKYVDNLH